MRYYIADCHFYHPALLDEMDGRNFEDVGAMNAYMLEKWNRKVRDRDDVVILGDFSWGSPEQTNELLQKLHGKLYLIQGNHDRFYKNKGYDASRFVWIKPYAELNDKKRKVVLCHYPIMCYNHQYRMDEAGNGRAYMLYGHVHDSRDQRLLECFQEMTRATVFQDREGNERHIPCNMINCFCMYSDYTPLTLDEWIVCDEARRARQAAEPACTKEGGTQYGHREV